jgi:hypothetical protein
MLLRLRALVHAEALARAATSGGETPAAKNTALRAARAALSDAEDELTAAQAALEQIETDQGDLHAASPQIENAVLVAVAEVVAPIAGLLLEQFRQKQVEAEILKAALLALVDEETVDLPMFRSDVQMLNAKDARRAPISAMRDRFFNPDPKAGQDRAREVGHCP